jgi:uncharacterized protein YndB with AHSA1/START domain
MGKTFDVIGKWIWGIVLTLTLVSVVCIIFSPYGARDGFGYKVVSSSVEINAPTSTVFDFLGNSANASRWSVYVNHIVPLNTDKFKDGAEGSVRRCYRNADNTGMQWDELISEVVINRKRQLLIYNFKNFPVSANHLATEQLYQSLDNQKTKLTFTVFFKNPPTPLEMLKMYFAAYKINSLFEKNMSNIKRIVEEENKNGAHG